MKKSVRRLVSYYFEVAMAAISTAELFSGIGGFRLAADLLGLQTVFANDWDTFAAHVYCANFGDDVLMPGDLLDCLHKLPSHEILTAGFPCQPFSYAGKKDGIADERADALDLVVDVLKKGRPRVAVLENVRSLLSMAQGRHMGAVLRKIEDAGYHVEWRVRNAIEFGLPQNRQRLFFLCIRGDLISEPVLHLGTEDEWMSAAEEYRAHCPLGQHVGSFPEWGRVLDGKMEAVRKDTRFVCPPVALEDVLDYDVDARYDFTCSTLSRLSESEYVGEMIEGVEVLWNQGGGRRMGYTVYGIKGAAPTLTSTTSRHYERFAVGGAFRRLTPVEYGRLQGFPDGHCNMVPHARRYVLYGSAVPPEMATWVLGVAKDVIEESA